MSPTGRDKATVILQTYLQILVYIYEMTMMVQLLFAPVYLICEITSKTKAAVENYQTKDRFWPTTAGALESTINKIDDFRRPNTRILGSQTLDDADEVHMCEPVYVCVCVCVCMRKPFRANGLFKAVSRPVGL